MKKLTKEELKAVYPVPNDLETKMRFFLAEMTVLNTIDIQKEAALRMIVCEALPEIIDQWFASRTKPQRIRDTMMERIKKDE